MTERVGFFTDTSLCIGCKACEVACKEWNQVPESIQGFTGESYDNTIDLGADTWRHVAFVEQRKVSTCAIRPGRRPRGPELLALVEDYRRRGQGQREGVHQEE